ncbi:MAG TPA: hypothetical protein VJY62_14265, partial [Bacteroidia bacterium]|nr:hypothetical protein [Bacteroidia bacterium]
LKKDSWSRIEIGTQTVAVNTHKNKNKNIKVLFPYKDNDSLIKTVSNRDALRKKINFITSRNRGLIISGPEKVIKLLKTISDGRPLRKAYKMEKLSKIEISEFCKILDTIYI